VKIVGHNLQIPSIFMRAQKCGPLSESSDSLEILGALIQIYRLTVKVYPRLLRDVGSFRQSSDHERPSNIVWLRDLQGTTRVFPSKSPIDRPPVGRCLAL
jgi:hypothetical protein